jgi:hypothetical protein
MIKKIVFVLSLGVQYAFAMGVSGTSALPSCYPCDASESTVKALPSCYPCEASVEPVKALPSCYPCDASV